MRIRKSELKKLVESVVHQVRESLEPPADQNMYMVWIDYASGGEYRNIYSVDELWDMATEWGYEKDLWGLLELEGREGLEVGDDPEFRGWQFRTPEAARYFTEKTGYPVEPHEIDPSLPDPETWTYAWWDDPEFEADDDEGDEDDF